MASDDEKVASIPSVAMCDQIYNELDSYLNGSINLKNSKAVKNAFSSLHKQIEQLKGQISTDLASSSSSNTKGPPPPPSISNDLSSTNPFNPMDPNNNNSIGSQSSPLPTEPLPSSQTKLMREETKNLPRELMKEGFVEKRGEGPLKGWKKRYLQLFSNKTIDYYVDSTLKELKGTIYLSSSNIKNDTKFENAIEVNYSINFGFNIHTINRKWEFKVDSTTERAQWITALNECIEQKGLKYRRATEMVTSSINKSNNNNNNINNGNYSVNNGNSDNTGNTNGGGLPRLASPSNTTKNRAMSSSLSFLGGNSEYLESVQNQLGKAQTERYDSRDNLQIKDFNVPERKFLQIQESGTSEADIVQSTDSIDI